MIGNECRPPGIRDAILALPFPTIFLACQARRIGGFGLVRGGITNPYQPPDLGRTFGRVAFTNLYHRGEDITHSGRDYVLCGVIMVCD